MDRHSDLYLYTTGHRQRGERRIFAETAELSHKVRLVLLRLVYSGRAQSVSELLSGPLQWNFKLKKAQMEEALALTGSG